jgi:hypothetical protein
MVGIVPVLILENYTGGTCSNCGTSIVISLEPKYMLHVAGRATVGKESDNMEVDLFALYDSFEDDTLLCHADSPTPPIYLKVDKGKIIPDKEKCLVEWNKRVLQHNATLADCKESGISKGEIDHTYSILLDRLLINYLRGRLEDSWQEFREGLNLLSKEDSRFEDTEGFVRSISNKLSHK